MSIRTIQRHFPKQRIKSLVKKAGRKIRLDFDWAGPFASAIEIKPSASSQQASQAGTASFFEKDCGSRVPCIDGYRFGLKAGWKYVAELGILHALGQRELLDAADAAFLKRSVGKNTLDLSIPEIRAYFQQVALPKYSSRVEIGSPLENPFLVPSKKQVSDTVQSFYGRHRELVDYLRDLGLLDKVNKGKRLLEIGYITGGYSILAFEKLGFDAMGIDNFYSGVVPASSLYEKVAQLYESKVEFLHGDVTQKTSLESGSVDLVVSTSVLEHLMNLEGAMDEFFRILKPGGIMVHQYDPYFHPKGGHALGILDSPWAHLRLDEAEYRAYLRQFRPHEADMAEEWYIRAIHRDYPAHKMQNLVIENGFDICAWNTTRTPLSEMLALSNDIVRDAFENYPGLSLEDLRASSHRLIAQKPL